MKTSKYNIYLTENNSFYIFNQLSSSLTQVDKELYLSLLDNNLDELDNPSLIPRFTCRQIGDSQCHATHLKKNIKIDHTILIITSPYQSIQ